MLARSSARWLMLLILLALPLLAPPAAAARPLAVGCGPVPGQAAP
jgi:hypothetical protein